jgi:hypothetical protein
MQLIQPAKHFLIDNEPVLWKKEKAISTSDISKNENTSNAGNATHTTSKALFERQ